MTAIKTQLLRTLATNSSRRKEDPRNSAFTLVELMVVIVIVGILSAVALSQLNAAQDRAKDSVARQEAVSAGKECSIFLLAGGTAPDGDQYIDVSIAADCASVTSTSESSDGTTYTVTLTDGVPGFPEEG